MNIYLHNRIVSTVAVIDASTDRLHIGNKWMPHSGLNWYDNTARMHDPVLMRFTSHDPLYTKYPDFSPWSHCAANPINVIDQNGERPTDLEGAVLAEHVYDGSIGDKLEREWEMIDVITSQYSSSFRAGLYSRTLDTGDMEYALAYAGTYFELSNRGLESIFDNISQLAGVSEDMTIAVNVAQSIKQAYGANEITILGHSKGGAEAVGASIATGIDAITYNSAKFNYTGMDIENITNIDNYIVEGEVLSRMTISATVDSQLQSIGYVGNINYLRSPANISSFERHSISTVIDILRLRH